MTDPNEEYDDYEDELFEDFHPSYTKLLNGNSRYLKSGKQAHSPEVGARHTTIESYKIVDDYFE